MTNERAAGRIAFAKGIKGLWSRDENALRTAYGWVVERKDENDEIIDTSEYETRELAEEFAEEGDDIALIKHRYTLVDGEVSRAYAYLDGGALPLLFDNGDEVPKRFQ